MRSNRVRPRRIPNQNRLKHNTAPSVRGQVAAVSALVDSRRGVCDENSVPGVQFIHELGFVPVHRRAGRCDPPCP